VAIVEPLWQHEGWRELAKGAAHTTETDPHLVQGFRIPIGEHIRLEANERTHMPL
jgi:hypothetical protein